MEKLLSTSDNTKETWKALKTEIEAVGIAALSNVKSA